MPARRTFVALGALALIAVAAAVLLSSRPSPASATGVTITAVAAGENHTCAVIDGGGVKCWGLNNNGQLGNGTTTNSNSPVDVCADAACTASMSGVVAIAAGENHTCALTDGGGVKCWGWNRSGQLGNGAVTDFFTPNPTATDVCVDPACELFLSDVVSLTAGGSHTCALGAGGGIRCWGSNGSGQLGDGTTVSRATSVVVRGLESEVAAISAGGVHTCALR